VSSQRHISRTGEINEALGTGSLISPHLLVTNHHVLETADVARHAAAEFGFEYDIAGHISATLPCRLAPETFFATDDALDLTVVAVAPREDRTAAGNQFGYNQLRERVGTLVLGEHLNVVQHPGGGPQTGVFPREPSHRGKPRELSVVRDRYGSRILRLTGLR